MSSASGTSSLATPSRVSRQQLVLAGLLVVEIAVFSVVGKNFFTLGNFADVLRQNAELGLLALAMTPVIVTGGIDLSVGSLMGLCAVVFGELCGISTLAEHAGRAHLPIALGVAIVLCVGMAAGGLNALLITKLRVPALIVTLGSYSLFRGIAQGMTGGSESFDFTRFGPFHLFGRGAWGAMPAPLPVLLICAAAAAFGLLLHRSAVGRGLSAIGYSPEGARYAGIPVGRRVALVYVLSGLAAGAAALVYVARLGQAKADAGTNFELSAITAVVLGGTSIFGGRGSVGGTVLGLLAIAVLQNGLRLAALRPELAGILTGVLLVLTIALDRRPARRVLRSIGSHEELNMRNSQLAALCAVILVAALIVVGGNFLLVGRIQKDLADRPISLNAPPESAAGTPGASARGAPPAFPAPRKFTIAVMPKSLGNAYFIAVKQGAEEAAKELGDDLLWDGSADPDPARQNEIVETWITRGVDVIAVAVENGKGISPALRKARDKGIKVVTFDSDADIDARDFFVNQATPQGIGYALMDNAARVMGEKGDFAIITATLTAANMNEWQKYIKLRLAEKYPNIRLVDVRPCDDIQKKAFDAAGAILNSQKNVKLLMAICSPAVPGAAEAVRQSGRTDVKVIGLGLPKENARYVKAGVTDCIVLWNTTNLGYLTVRAAHDVAAGTLKNGAKSMDAGRLGKVELEGDNIILGKPFTFTKDNIDQFNF